VLLFGFSTDQLAKAGPNRVGQCLLTCPTTAVFNGLPNSEEQIPLGEKLRFFGDGFQKSKLLSGRRYWRIPVMDGEFLVEEELGVEKGIAGGNLIIQGVDQPTTLSAARRAVEAIAELPGVIAPFPGGVVRSGSKVGARYKGMIASTNDAFCPTLRGRVPSELVEGANCCYEIVINGVDESSIATAMRSALHAASGPGIPAISAGNYGGKLGKFHFRLREVLS
jgi:formylmethanofuran--tetrahydromethanopterin N-formyltransferase